MGGGVRRWLSSVRRSLARSSCRSIAVVEHTVLIHEKHEQVATPDFQEEEEDVKEEEQTKSCVNYRNHEQEVLQVEDLAAIKLQSCFRGHLARRAFRALRSLVKLQARVRGADVRRQTRMAAHCVHALARLHHRVRSRQLPNGTVYAEPIIPTSA